MNVLQFDHITEEVIALARGFERAVTPSWEELSDLQAIDGKPLRILALVEGDRCVALSCCTIEQRRIAGVQMATYTSFGDTFFDYNCLLCELPALGRLLEEMAQDARSVGADRIVLKNIPLPIPESVHKAISPPRQIYIFDSNIDENGYQPLLRKKSLKRHLNKCKRTFAYDCQHYIGDDIPLAEIEKMGALHRETRRFHDTFSAFNDAGTVDRYMAHLENKVLTKISVGDDALAYHYGMLFDKTMIWHTPVVNIKYYNYSPLEVLLFEMISYCDQHDITVFDLGIGDEAYKLRFSNAQREVSDIEIQLSTKARILSGLKHADKRLELRNRIAHLGSKMPNAQPIGRARTTGIEQGEASSPQLLAREGAHVSVVAKSFEEYVEYSRKNSLAITHQDYEKCRKGMVYCRTSGDDNDKVQHFWAQENPETAVD